MGNENHSIADFPNEIQHDCLLKAPFFIAVLNMQGSVVFFNKEAEEKIGCPLSSIRGKDFIDLFISPEKKESFRNHFFGCNGKEIPQKPYVCIFLSKDEKPHYMEWTGIREEHEGKSCLLLIGKDMTEIFSKVSGLLSQILHEVNNCTTFIIGNTPFLKEAWSDIQDIMDMYQKQNPDLEIARLPYDFFRQDYPQVIEDIETGSRRIRKVVSQFREIERMIHEQKK